MIASPNKAYLGKLSIRLVEARGLKNKGALGSHHSYVVSECKGENQPLQQQRSPTAKGSTPKWDFSFILDVSDKLENVVLQLWYHKKVSGDFLAGIGTVDVPSHLKKDYDEWVIISSVSSGKKNEGIVGELHICTKFAPSQLFATQQTQQALDSVNEDGPIFGVPIELLLNRKDNDSMVIPKIIATCIEWLKSNGAAEVDGIFLPNKCPSQDIVDKKKQFNQEGQHVRFSRDTNPHLVACILKGFFLDLPDPLISIARIPKSDGFAISLPALLTSIDKEASAIVEYVLEYLQVVAARSHKNGMTAAKIGETFAPLFTKRNSEETAKLSEAISRFFSGNRGRNQRQSYPGNFSDSEDSFSNEKGDPPARSLSFNSDPSEEGSGQYSGSQNSDEPEEEEEYQASQTSSKEFPSDLTGGLNHFALAQPISKEGLHALIATKPKKNSSDTELLAALEAKEAEIKELELKLQEVQKQLDSKTTEDEWALSQLKKHVEKLQNAQNESSADFDLKLEELEKEVQEKNTALQDVTAKKEALEKELASVNNQHVLTQFEQRCLSLQQQLEQLTQVTLSSSKAALESPQDPSQQVLLSKLDELLALQKPSSPPLTHDEQIEKLVAENTSLKASLAAKDDTIAHMSKMIREREQAVCEAVALLAEHKKMAASEKSSSLMGSNLSKSKTVMPKAAVSTSPPENRPRTAPPGSRRKATSNPAKFNDI